MASLDALTSAVGDLEAAGKTVVKAVSDVAKTVSSGSSVSQSEIDSLTSRVKSVTSSLSSVTPNTPTPVTGSAPNVPIAGQIVTPPVADGVIINESGVTETPFGTTPPLVN